LRFGGKIILRKKWQSHEAHRKKGGKTQIPTQKVWFGDGESKARRPMASALFPESPQKTHISPPENIFLAKKHN